LLILQKGAPKLLHLSIFGSAYRLFATGRIGAAGRAKELVKTQVFYETFIIAKHIQWLYNINLKISLGQKNKAPTNHAYDIVIINNTSQAL